MRLLLLFILAAIVLVAEASRGSPHGVAHGAEGLRPALAPQ